VGSAKWELKETGILALELDAHKNLERGAYSHNFKRNRPLFPFAAPLIAIALVIM
jgi:hypothetical protein